MFQVKIHGFNNLRLFLLRVLKVIGFKQNNLHPKAILLDISVVITVQRIGCQHFLRKTTNRGVKIVKDISMPHIYGRTNTIKNIKDKKRLFKTTTNHIWANYVRLVKEDAVNKVLLSTDLFKIYYSIFFCLIIFFNICFLKKLLTYHLIKLETILNIKIALN